MIGFVCLCSRSVDKPIGDRLVIGTLPITGFALGKNIADRLRLVIDGIGMIGTSTFSGGERGTHSYHPSTSAGARISDTMSRLAGRVTVARATGSFEFQAITSGRG